MVKKLLVLETNSLILETGIFDRVVKMKYDVPNNNLALFDDYYKEIDEAVASID